MTKFTLFAAIVILNFSILGCKKNPPTPNPPTPAPQLGNAMPEDLVFALVNKQGRNLITNPTSLKMTYVDSNGRLQNISLNTTEQTVLFKVDSTQNLPYTYVFQSLAPSVVSGLLGVKTFFLEVGGKKDTLYYDVQHTRPKAVTNQFDVVEASFNGKPAELRVFPATGAPYYVVAAQVAGLQLILLSRYPKSLP